MFQIASIFGIGSVIVLLSPKLSSNAFVFSEYINETGFNGGSSITVYVCSIGLIMPLYAMIGYECGGTMAEETK